MRKVEVKINIRTSPEKVIAAFTNPDMLKEWWFVEKTLIEKKSGGLYTLTWNVTDKGFGYVSTGIIKSYITDKELVIENFVYRQIFSQVLRLWVRNPSLIAEGDRALKRDESLILFLQRRTNESEIVEHLRVRGRYFAELGERRL